MCGDVDDDLPRVGERERLLNLQYNTIVIIIIIKNKKKRQLTSVSAPE